MKTMKSTSLLLALLIIVCIFSACSKFEYDNSTIYAKVTAIDGQKVTFLVGEMSIDENMMQGGFSGDMGNMIPPTGDGEMPQMPNGNIGEIPEFSEGETMPDMGDIQFTDGEILEGMDILQMPFSAGDDTISLTLNEDTVNTLSLDAVVQITFGDNGSVQSLTVVGGNIQGGKDFSNMTIPATEDNADTENSDS